MKTFFLDLASHAGVLACVDGKAVVALKEADHRMSDAELLPFFEALLAEAKWTKESIERIACVTGPGGFTSLRVAAAFTNALSFALYVPATGIHLSDLKRMQCPQKNFLWLHSTKKHELFSRGFGTYARDYPESAHARLEDFVKTLPEGVPWIGELIPEHEEAIRAKGAVQVPLQGLSSVLPAFLSDQKYEKRTIEPWYGRKW